MTKYEFYASLTIRFVVEATDEESYQDVAFDKAHEAFSKHPYEICNIELSDGEIVE